MWCMEVLSLDSPLLFYARADVGGSDEAGSDMTAGYTELATSYSRNVDYGHKG